MFQGFQRLQKNLNLDFLDSKIAEEQAKQQQQQQQQQQPARGSSPAKRTHSNAGTRRTTGRGDGQAARLGGRLRPEDVSDANLGPASKGLDPEDFVIGEDVSDMSRAATPHPVKEGADGQAKDVEKAMERESGTVKGKEKADPGTPSQDAGQRLAKLTARYQDLLRNYRTAHAHVATILPFEATLREHTPLTSISDPGALVEFLAQRNLQNEMVLQELKRVTFELQHAVQERDELKAKVDEMEKTVQDSGDENVGLRNKLGKSEQKTEETFFSDKEETSHTFFSDEEEVSHTGADDKNHAAQVERPAQEEKVQTVRASEQSAEIAEAHGEPKTAHAESGNLQDEDENKEHQVLRILSEMSEARTRDIEKESELQKETRDTSSSAKQQEKRITVMEQLIATLKGQLSDAKQSQEKYDSEIIELQVENDKLRGEAKSLSKLVDESRHSGTKAQILEEQASLRGEEHDEAKKIAELNESHEAKIVNLRSQLSRAEKDRELAYKMLIACRRCEVASKEPEDVVADGSGIVPRSRSISDVSRTDIAAHENNTTSSTQDVPSIEGDGSLAPVDASKKAKKKKKSKAKKKPLPPEPSGDIPTVENTSGSNFDRGERHQDQSLGGDLFLTQELLQGAEVDEAIFPFLTGVMRNILENEQDHVDEPRDAKIARIRREVELTTNFSAEVQRMVHNRTQKLGLLQGAVATAQSDQDSNVPLESLEQESELRAQLNNLQDEREVLQKEYDNLQEIHGTLQEEHKTLQEERGTLQEEHETLQESLIDIGQRATDYAHVMKEVKREKDNLEEKFQQLYQERIDGLTHEINDLKQRENVTDEIQGVQEQLEMTQRERESLQAAKEDCENQIEALKVQLAVSAAESEARYNALSADLEKARSKSVELEKELAAANQLAQTRFRDLTSLREHHNTLQPELKRLRDESAELKTVKADLERVAVSVKKLEAKERDLRSEIAEHKSQSSTKDGELLSLREKLKKSDERKVAMEEACDKARKDLERLEVTRTEIIDARDKAQGDAKRYDHELRTSRSRLEEAEKQVRKLSDETNRLRDEVQMKTAQELSAQSAMDNMRDQTREFATQMKEVREQNESLEEELQDAQRLLSERSREGETMRRLLKDVEARAEQTVNQMKQEKEVATEQRDRAEDEANTIGRKKTREIEDLKSKLRDAEDLSRRATDAKHDVERRQHEFQTQHEELFRRSKQVQEELTEVRAAMTQLRETLDEGERQSHELEKEKMKLRKILEERETQLERLKKSSRTMAEELQKHKAPSKGSPTGGTAQSSRTSTESARVKSPVSKSGTDAVKTGDSKGGVDVFYLKNVLLQFLEQKEKKTQMQLIPVLSRLLKFNQEEERKWMAVISSK